MREDARASGRRASTLKHRIAGPLQQQQDSMKSSPPFVVGESPLRSRHRAPGPKSHLVLCGRARPNIGIGLYEVSQQVGGFGRHIDGPIFVKFSKVKFGNKIQLFLVSINVVSVSILENLPFRWPGGLVGGLRRHHRRCRARRSALWRIGGMWPEFGT